MVSEAQVHALDGGGFHHGLYHVFEIFWGWKLLNIHVNGQKLLRAPGSMAGYIGVNAFCLFGIFIGTSSCASFFVNHLTLFLSKAVVCD